MLLHGGTNNPPQFEDLKGHPILSYRKQPESNMNPISGDRPDTLEGWVTHLKTQPDTVKLDLAHLNSVTNWIEPFQGLEQFTV